MIKPTMTDNDSERWSELGRLFMNRPEAAYRLTSALRIARLGLDPYETAALDDVAATLHHYTRHYKASRYLYSKALKGQLSADHDPVKICQSIDPKWEEVLDKENVDREYRRLVEGSKIPSLLLTHDVAKLIHKALAEGTTKRAKRAPSRKRKAGQTER
jgi:hypothetical protein